MWTPLAGSEFSTAGSVAVRVLPSPVFISAIEPAWRTMPPIIWTSKWRMPSVRREVSRTTAKVSASRSSRDSPLRARSRRPSACPRSSASSSSSSSGSHVLMRSTRFAYCLNCLPSPSRRARSRIVMPPSVDGAAARPAPSDRRELTLGGLGRDGRGGPLLAPPAALVAVALDLAAELVGDEVDRVVELTGGVLGPQRDALEVQRRLGHLALGVGRIALLEDLDLEDRQLAHLLGDLLEAAGDVLAQLLGDRKVAPLDLDLHGTPLMRRMSPRAPDPTGPGSQGPRICDRDHLLSPAGL